MCFCVSVIIACAVIQLGSGGSANHPADDGKEERNVASEGRDQLPDLVAEVQDARGCTRV